MTALGDRIRNAAESLFDIEHRVFSSRLGLTRCVEEKISLDFVPELVYAIDELCWSKESTHHRLAIQLIALTWEHSDGALQNDLREFFVVSLSRLGVAPATVMVDDDLRRLRRYSPFESFSASLATVSLQLPEQIAVGEFEYQLTKFQKRAFEAIAKNRLTGLSAPTSAGKSYAIYLSIVSVAMSAESPVVYIVPTISLLNQVSEDLRDILNRHGLQSWIVANSYTSGRPQSVFVLTQERAIVAVDMGLSTAALAMLVVDEVQNLERVTSESDLRSKILYDFMQDIRAADNVEKIVLSGPRLDNVGFIGSDIFGVESAEERAVESPVANLTYAIERVGNGYMLNQYRDSLGGRASITVTNSKVVQGIGQSTYTDGFYTYLNHLVESLGDRSRNLIFSPTTEQARRTAQQLTGLSPAARDDALHSLSEYLANSIHPGHTLVQTVKSGVAFHSGKVPPHARLAIEQAFSDGLLKDIVCTTTLMQGVNLPADIVLVRNPKLYVKKTGDNPAELSAYEFANLRGRAGRLLKHFVGRTVVLDEGSFRPDDGQGDLFGEANKTLRPGYGELFEENRADVLAELKEPGSSDTDAAKFIASHIRQTSLRHNSAAMRRLAAVGIGVDATLLARVQRDIQALTVPKEVLLSNRYWDPFDLQEISDQLSGGGVGQLPNDVWQKNVASRVAELIEFQSAVSPSYFRRYLGSAISSRFCYLIAKSAESWGRETPLRTIIEDRHFSGDVDLQIDNQVALIYRQVVYGLTALLKPIAELQGTGAPLLASFESGVYHPATQFMTSLGLYRETAVQVKRKLLPQVRANDPDLERTVSSRILAGMGSLDPWTARQVAAIISRQSIGERYGQG